MSQFVKWTVSCVALVTALAGPARADLLVGNFNTDEILRFDPTTGASLGVFAGGGEMGATFRMIFGPDGNLYVGSAGVVRYNGSTGAPLGTFVPRGSGGLDSPFGLTFGPDGNLYVYDFFGSVLRYDGATGASLGTFIPNASGGFQSGNLTFGPDGHLYVATQGIQDVLRFDGATGASLGVFASVPEGLPEDLTFGPDGNLYVVTGLEGSRVYRFDGTTGASLGAFTDFIDFGVDLEFGPDGNLYVADSVQQRVLRFDGTTGALLGTIPVSLPDPDFQLSSLTFTPTAVPEPSSLALLGLGSVGLLGGGCWRKWSRRFRTVRLDKPLQTGPA